MTPPARSEYRTVIVGAGIIGLYTAYHLARAGAGPILLVDRGFLSSGASGRNGGGVRQQWETRATIRLARESVDSYRRFAREFGYNPWFRQSGYLFLAESPEELERLRVVQMLVRSEGLPSELLGAEEVLHYVPGLARGAAVGGTYLASDGTLYPFPAIWGVYEAVRALGVDVALGVEALGVERDATGHLSAVVTSRGRIVTPTCVNAAGGWSAEFSRRAGLVVPNLATRHEILATEPLKAFLNPMVVRASDGLYFSQTMRGEIVGGLSPTSAQGLAPTMASTPYFLARMARALVGLLPRLAGLGVLRAWSGFYDDTPDGRPIIGTDPSLPGFVHANGFGGYGFMLAPAATRRVAREVLGEKTDLDPREFGPGRFDGDRPRAASEALHLG
jgi:sarcosine oxidase subunit beta